MTRFSLIYGLLILLLNVCTTPVSAVLPAPESPLGTLLQTAPEDTPATSRPVRILLLGDSLSAGFGMDYEQSWVPRLQRKLDTMGADTEIINASISGETSGGGRARLQQLLDEHQPQVLWIELGGNDGLRGYPLKQLYANLADMITVARDRELQVWLTHIQIPPNLGPRYTREFEAVFTRLMTRFPDLVPVPFVIRRVALDSELMMQDGIHPRVEAQPLIAEDMLDWMTQPNTKRSKEARPAAQ